MIKIYRCAHCGNIITMLHDSNVPVFCCGQKMDLLVAGSTDAAVEKHVPAVSVNGRTVEVQVGSVAHPMTPEHYIEWVLLETAKGFSVQNLAPTTAPTATFALAEGEAPKAVYAYCNLHGLWKADL